jgi:plastocyanin
VNRKDGRVVAVARLLLLGALSMSCGDNSVSAPSPSSNDRSDESAEVPTPVEEKPFACLGRKKGPVVELKAGRAGGDALERVRWYPHDLKVPAGRFVTIRITNPSSTPHDFLAEALECKSEPIRSGDTITVSFKVPAGETDFVCPLHPSFMTGNIIGKE